MTNLELVFHYVGMFIILIRNSINLNKKSYSKKVLLYFKIDIYKPVSLLIKSKVTNSMLFASEN